MDIKVYQKLGTRMNANQNTLILTEPVLALLAEVFDEREADLAGDMPLGAHTPKELSKVLKRDEPELRGILEGMNRKGIIFEGKRAGGEKEYSVLPFEPGLFELRFLEGRTDEETRKFGQMIEACFASQFETLETLFQDPNFDAKAAFEAKKSRFLPIEEAVPSDSKIASWESIMKLIENETSFCIGTCGCKWIQKLKGHECKSGHYECCTYIGKVADWLVERGAAKRVTKEEYIARIKEFREAGLVQFTANAERPVCICNCCSCCCQYVKSVKRLRGRGITLSAVNFMSVVDAGTCAGCGKCAAVCGYDARKAVDGKMTTNDFCVGCGQCVRVCPNGAAKLVRVANAVPPEPASEVVGYGY